MKRLAGLVLGLAVLGVAGATAQDGHDHDHDHAVHEPAADRGRGHDDDHHDEAVHLDDAQLAEFAIELAVAGPDTIETYVTLPGEVRANADRLAHIVPRFSGIVTEVRVKVGDRVEKGQTLAIVESDESLAPFEVRTLIGGTVIEKHIALGEAVDREGDTFLIADLSTVWVDLTVYQRDLDRIRTGQPARIFVGHEVQPDHGVIGYVTPIVDKTTRTATARVVLPNPEGKWRPGMFVRGRVLVERVAAAVAVPRTALQTLDGRTTVFVETAEGFRPRSIRIGREGETEVEVADGLAAGERYVSRGGFTIKAELGRESLGHAGHAH